MRRCVPHIVPGVTTGELDKIAEDFVRSKGAIPSYIGYGASPARRGQPAIPPFPATICVAVNDVICHGIPSTKQALREGDIVGIDIGVHYNGWVGDSCMTFPVGKVDSESERLIAVAKRSMELGIEQARSGKHLGDIGAAIQTYCEAQGFSTVREYTGHGVGKETARGTLCLPLWTMGGRLEVATRHGLHHRTDDKRGAT